MHLALMQNLKMMHWKTCGPSYTVRLRFKAIFFHSIPGKESQEHSNSVPEVGPLLSEHLKFNGVGEIVWLRQHHTDVNPFHHLGLCERQ